MANTVILRGHVVGSTTVEVDEPIPQGTTEVEVVLHLRAQGASQKKKLSEYLRSLPPGTRTKEDIDRQIEEERNSWRD